MPNVGRPSTARVRFSPERSERSEVVAVELTSLAFPAPTTALAAYVIAMTRRCCARAMPGSHRRSPHGERTAYGNDEPPDDSPERRPPRLAARGRLRDGAGIDARGRALQRPSACRLPRYLDGDARVQRRRRRRAPAGPL